MEIGMTNLDKFAYIGLFSAATSVSPAQLNTIYDGVFADPAAFNKKVKYFFIGIGSAENIGGNKQLSDMFNNAGIKNDFFLSEGTEHEWLTWRRCLHAFAPHLFKKK